MQITDLEEIVRTAWENRDNPEAMESAFSEYLGPMKDAPEFLFEHANALDFMGREAEAIPLFRMAISLGMSGEYLLKARIQPGSSLSATGNPPEALAVLEDVYEKSGEPSALAFLCIALHRSGRDAEALKKSLEHLLECKDGFMENYSRALGQYLVDII